MQRIADREAVGRREREGHRAADQDGVGALGQRLEHADLVGHLDAAGDHDERMLGIVQQSSERLQLAPQQQPGRARQQVRDALGGGVRAVGGAEGVVDVDIGELRERGRELRVVGRLARVEAQVLEQQHVAVAQLADGLLGDRPDAVGRPRHGPAEQVGQVLAHGLQRGGRVGLALRPAEVRAQDHARAALAQQRDRRQRRADARVVRDRAVLQRHVEVDAAEHPPAGDLQRIQAARQRAGHRTLVIRSTSRFEKPHSLSYQEMTLAWRP